MLLSLMNMLWALQGILSASNFIVCCCFNSLPEITEIFHALYNNLSHQVNAISVYYHYLILSFIFSRGHCILFSTSNWREDGQFAVNWASQAYCNYSIFVGVILFLASAIQIYRMSVYLYKGTDR